MCWCARARSENTGVVGSPPNNGFSIILPPGVSPEGMPRPAPGPAAPPGVECAWCAPLSSVGIVDTQHLHSGDITNTTLFGKPAVLAKPFCLSQVLVTPKFFESCSAGTQHKLLTPLTLLAMCAALDVASLLQQHNNQRGWHHRRLHRGRGPARGRQVVSCVILLSPSAALPMHLASCTHPQRKPTNSNLQGLLFVQLSKAGSPR